MQICPQCGRPISIDGTILAPKELNCDRCGWAGVSTESVIVDDSLANLGGFQSQLEKLYVGLAEEVAPVLGKLLIQTGMILAPRGVDSAEDKSRIQFLAKVLQGATRGTIEGLARTIKEEMDHGRN